VTVRSRKRVQGLKPFGVAQERGNHDTQNPKIRQDHPSGGTRGCRTVFQHTGNLRERTLVFTSREIEKPETIYTVDRKRRT
jgi:hypothetical protein